MKSESKLKGRDLINIGIYSAIYFVILFAVAMLGMIPIFLPLLSVFVPIIGGIPFMLFNKGEKARNDFIMAMIMGILMLLTGMGPWPLLTCAIAGGLAELCFKSGEYKNAKKRFSLMDCSVCGFSEITYRCLRTTRDTLHRERIMVRHILMRFQNSCPSGWHRYYWLFV